MRRVRRATDRCSYGILGGRTRAEFLRPGTEGASVGNWQGRIDHVPRCVFNVRLLATDNYEQLLTLMDVIITA